MTLTIIMDAETEKLDKQGRIYGLTGRGLKLVPVKVTFGASDDYATGGVSANLKVNGVKQILAVIPQYTDSLLIPFYDKTNSKIILYGQGADGTAAGVLTELANASQATRSKVFEFLVLGR